MKSIAFSLAAPRKNLVFSKGCGAPKEDGSVCNAQTREGKPFCPDHIEHQSYVQNLVALLADKDSEEELVKKKGHKAVSPSSLTVQEILQDLRVHGQLTLPKLALDVGIEREAMEGYVDFLVRAKMVVKDDLLRGEPFIRLAEATPALIADKEPTTRKPRKPKSESRRLRRLAAEETSQTT